MLFSAKSHTKEDETKCLRKRQIFSSEEKPVACQNAAWQRWERCLQAGKEPCSSRSSKRKDANSWGLFLSPPRTTLLIFSLLLMCDDKSFRRKVATSEPSENRQLAG